jgi:hypothetical protein
MCGAALEQNAPQLPRLQGSKEIHVAFGTLAEGRRCVNQGSSVSGLVTWQHTLIRRVCVLGRCFTILVAHGTDNLSR